MLRKSKLVFRFSKLPIHEKTSYLIKKYMLFLRFYFNSIYNIFIFMLLVYMLFLSQVNINFLLPFLLFFL